MSAITTVSLKTAFGAATIVQDTTVAPVGMVVEAMIEIETIAAEGTTGEEQMTGIETIVIIGVVCGAEAAIEGDRDTSDRIVWN